MPDNNNTRTPYKEQWGPITGKTDTGEEFSMPEKEYKKATQKQKVKKQ